MASATKLCYSIRYEAEQTKQIMNNATSVQRIAHKTTFFWGIAWVIFFVLFFFQANSAIAAITGQLDFGSSGSDVVELQAFLALNTDIYPSVRITGYFDVLTQSATERFQTAQGIVSQGTPETTGYGRVGPKTLIRVNKLIYLIPTDPIRSSLVSLVEDGVVPLDPPTAGRPVHLKIPGINVDSVVEYVGMTSLGAMDMTKSLDNVAWFKLGKRPGENGSAVIGGHFSGGKNGNTSVFDNLYKLRPGDKIFVEDDQGNTITFVVRESRRYDSKADATDIFSSNDGKAHLNIITCDGVWNKYSSSYSQRLVVFTDKEQNKIGQF